MVALLAFMALRGSTALLSPQGYGQYALLLAIQTLCGLFLINPIGQHINRHTHEWADQSILLGRLRRLRLYVAGCGVLGGLVAAVSIDNLPPGPAALVMVCLVSAGTWNTILIPTLNMLGYRRQAVIWSVATASVGLAASMGLASWNPSPLSWITGQVIGLLVGAAGAQRALRYAIVDYDDGKALIDRKTIVAYCLPLALATGLMWLQLNGYRFVVERFWGLETLAIVAVGLTMVAQLWSIIETLSYQYLVPLFYRRLRTHPDRRNSEALSDLINSLGPVYMILAGCVTWGAGALLFTLTDSKYHHAIPFVIAGAIVECARSMTSLLANGAQITKRPAILAVPYGVGAITTFGLIDVSYRSEGAYGLPLALGLGAALLAVVMAVVIHAKIGFRLDWRRWSMAALFWATTLATSSYVPTVDGLVEAVLHLFVIGLLGALVIIAMSLRNPSLVRLMATPLVFKGRAV